MMVHHPFGYDPETTSFVAFEEGTVDRNLFVGYGFAGRDMLISEDGRASWEATTGGSFAGGEDGTYAIVSQTGATIRVEVDHCGHMPVFYYSDGRVAAASNSIVRLIRHLRSVGVHVRPNPAEVAARGTDFFPLHQLATFETSVVGVKILPVGFALMIRAGHCSLERLPPPVMASYYDDLKTCIATWADRIATLLDSGKFRLSFDLSGGRDSRTVFALLHLVMQVAPPEWMERVSIHSHGFLSPLDPEIAEEVLCKSESALPHGYQWSRSFTVSPYWGQSSRPIRDPFWVWWTLCGGIYSPNYLASNWSDPDIVLFGGGGGASYRSFYSNYFPTPKMFAASCSQRIGLPDHTGWLREQILSTFEALKPGEGKEANPMILHYREFRGRLHGGRRSRNCISLMPVSSRLLERATLSLMPTAMDEGQIFHDIIGNCAPPLRGVRFDADKKAPTPEVNARFVDCGVGSYLPQPGTVHGTPVTKAANAVNVDGLRQLADAVEAAGKLPYVREIWSAEAILRAIDMSAKAASAGRFPHPNPASLVAGILMAGMFD